MVASLIFQQSIDTFRVRFDRSHEVFSLLPVLFTANRNEEIVMPSERSGKIKENYEWKVRILW